MAVLVALVLLALANLDARPMKGWVRGLVRDQGVALDFAAGKLTLGGVRFRDLRVASAPADRARAPDLVRIGAIDGRWSLWSRRLDELVLRDVTLTVVRSADGTTSLERWLAGLPPSEEPPPEPLSALASKLVPAGLEAHARLEGVTVVVHDETAPGGRTLTVTGLSARADLASGALALALGPGPLRLSVAEAGRPARELVLSPRLALRLDATGKGSAELGLALERQDLVPALPALRQLVELSATLQLAPASGRTTVELTRMALLDGALTASSTVTLIDRPAPEIGEVTLVLDQAALTLDVQKLAALAPPELGPLEVASSPLTVTVRDASLTPTPRGQLSAALDLARLRWRDLALERLRVGASLGPDPRDGDLLRGELRVPLGAVRAPGVALDGLELSAELERPGLRALTAGAPWQPVTVRANVALRELAAALAPTAPRAAEAPAPRAAAPATPLRARDLALDASAVLRAPRALDASLTASLAELGAGPARAAATLTGLSARASATALTLATPPLASTGELTLELDVADAKAAGGPRAHQVRARARARLAGAAPATAALELTAAQLAVPGLRASLGPAFAGGPAALKLTAPRLVLDAQAPARSSGDATISASYGGASVEGTLGGSAQKLAWELTARAPHLGPAHGVTAKTSGSLEPASGAISQDTTLDVAQVRAPAAALEGAHVHAASRGTTQRHEGTVAIALAQVRAAGKALGAATLELGANADLTRPALELRLRGSEPPADLRVSAAVEPSRAVRWQAKGTLGGLAAAAAFLPPGLDWSRVTLEVDGAGEVTGVIASLAGGVPVPAPMPALSARGRQRLALTVRELHYLDPAHNRADVPAITIKADLALAEVRKATVEVEVPRLQAMASGVKLDAEALSVRGEAALTLRKLLGVGLVPGDVDATLTVRARSVKQSALPWYGVRAPELTARVSGDPERSLALALRLANPGGGTAFELAGDLERNEAAGALVEAPDGALGAAEELSGIVARRSLVLDGKLSQSLDGLDAAPGTLRARGKVSVPFRVESGDLVLFRTSAQVSLTDVGLELPRSKIALERINGELPVVQELVLGPGGVERVGQGEHGLFSQLRFPDYKPFAGGSDFLSIGKATVRGVELGPVAGNARIDRDVIALDQLELGALGGKLTGQLLAEVRGADTRLAFRGKATGVRPSVASATTSGGPSGERLDANLAVTVTPYRLGLEGRTEIVQIGKDHLLALLDVWDPYRSDVAANRVRLALKVGYPKQVRLHFSRGFASLAIELGGLAGVVRIDEIRGIPIGPVLGHFLAPLLPSIRPAARPAQPVAQP